MKNLLKRHFPKFGAREIYKYIGPGFIVTVGFIDPGNWASNIAAGSQFGYSLLWMVTLSTIMLIFLQHNAAHLGIATGLCLSEASTTYMPRKISRLFLTSAMIASICTTLAEILGAAIGLQMLFNIPIVIGAIISLLSVLIVVFTNSYKRIEKYIIGFVSIIGLSFIYELSLVNVEWVQTFSSWVKPTIPLNSMPIIMSVLGAVVMPHNIFLHSEIIQSRQWNLESDKIINKQLKYEFIDTLVAMLVGWAINSAMIIVAASVFYKNGVLVTELPQAQETLRPLVGESASRIFAIALLMSGFSSSVTSAMAGGSIFAGIFREPYDIDDSHSKIGVLITTVFATIIIFFLKDPFKGLVWSQICLSMQLPFTVFALIFLTSSKRVMGKFVNSIFDKITLTVIAIIVTVLNILLLKQMLLG